MSWYEKLIDCTECGGSGFNVSGAGGQHREVPCESCDGSGTIWVDARVIPGDRRVVCAAVKSGGLTACSARHFDPIMRSQMLCMDNSMAIWKCASAVQGFIDQYGVFMTREEAWEVADAAGQIIRRVGGDEGRLFSENLY